jgi:hypothetical protein
MNQKQGVGCSLTITLVLIVVILFDLGGWGTFLTDLAKGLVMQTFLALFIYGVLQVIVYFSDEPSVTDPLAPIIFPIAAVISLPVLSRVLGRSIDGYDVFLTILLMVVFPIRGKFIKFLSIVRVEVKEFFEVILARPTSPDPPPKAAPYHTYALEGEVPFVRIEKESSEEEEYQKLVDWLFGNREHADRLIEYERKRFPDAGRKELIKRALGRLK